jgi:16S rRNA (guanine966-N2)-methyltransferase
MRMRIIAGELKGRFIKAPETKFTRPTTDRVRETVFNLLNNRIDFDGINVLDIYAGSGSLGFECLSRGAASVSFIEKNFPVYKNLQENIDSLGVKERCKIYKMEAVKFSSWEEHPKYDLVLADPPFFDYDIYAVVKNLLANNFLAPEGFIWVERSIQTREKDIEGFGKEPFKKVGDSLLYEFTG